jgi:trigger factor
MTVKNIEKKEKNSLLITVEIEKEKFEEAINAAYKKGKGKINIPGFRKGKAPLKIIENMYGASVFYEDAVDIIAPEAYVFALEQEKLNTVGRPTLFDMKFGEDRTATLVFRTALYPEVSLKQYKGLEAVKSDVDVTDEEVKNEIEVARNKNSRLVSVEDRAAIISDTAIIDFEGFLNGTPFEGGKAEKFSLKLGSASFVPGFEEQVSGMKVGEEKEIGITFPENYALELAGKDVVFKVKLHEIKETVFPALDDEFAKDVSEFDTLEEYKKSVCDTIAARKSDEANTSFRARLLEKLVENLEAEIPDVMVEDQLEKVLSDYSMKMEQQGFSLEDYLKMTGMSSEDFIKNLRPGAENQVKATLSLKKIIELENIVPTDDEIDAEYTKLAEKYKIDIERVKAAITPEQMKEDLAMMKAEELVCDNGVAIKAEDISEDKTDDDASGKKTKSKAATKDNDVADKKPSVKKTAKKTEDKE